MATLTYGMFASEKTYWENFPDYYTDDTDDNYPEDVDDNYKVKRKKKYINEDNEKEEKDNE